MGIQKISTTWGTGSGGVLVSRKKKKKKATREGCWAETLRPHLVEEVVAADPPENVHLVFHFLFRADAVALIGLLLHRKRRI